MSTYKYVTKNEYKSQSTIIWNIIRNVQKKLKNEMGARLNVLLIGSTKHRLVTKKNNEHYDFDFNLVITNWDNLPNNKKVGDVRQKIFDLLQEEKDEKWTIKNNTKVIRLKNSNDQCNFEFAVCYIKGGETFVVKLDKTISSYFSNEESHDIRTIFQDFSKIKGANVWQDFKELYLEKKNDEKNEDKRSYSLYKETIKEIKEKHGIE